MDWRTARTLVIDTETTGADSENDRIVEIGWLSFEGGNIAGAERFCSLVNPQQPIRAEATAVHGITDDDVAEQPQFWRIARRFMEQVERAEVLVAYNWSFDFSFIAEELNRIDCDQEDEPGSLRDMFLRTLDTRHIIDPLVVVREVDRFVRGKGRHKLGTTAQRYGINRIGDAHRADSDAELAARVLHTARIANALPIDAKAAAEWCKLRGAEQDARFQEWLARQPKREAS